MDVARRNASDNGAVAAVDGDAIVVEGDLLGVAVEKHVVCEDLAGENRRLLRRG